MAWLRLDDTFDTHPKLLALGTDERRWTWQRVLLYTCRHRTDIMPKNIRDVVPKATPAFVRDCIEIGLLEKDEHGALHVHDWHEYNGSDSKLLVRDRVRRYRERNAEVTPEVTQSNAKVTPQVTDAVTAPALPKRDSRAAARARPVPNPTPTTTPSSSKDIRASIRKALDDDDLETAITNLDLNRDQHTVALETLASEPGRLRAAIEAALANGTKLAPYVDEILRNGTWPEQPSPPARPASSGPTCPECGIVVMAPTTLADHLWHAHEIEPPVGDTRPEPTLEGDPT